MTAKLPQHVRKKVTHGEMRRYIEDVNVTKLRSNEDQVPYSLPLVWWAAL
jgi:hypothetical protein